MSSARYPLDGPEESDVRARLEALLARTEAAERELEALRSSASTAWNAVWNDPAVLIARALALLTAGVVSGDGSPHNLLG